MTGRWWWLGVPILLTTAGLTLLALSLKGAGLVVIALIALASIWFAFKPRNGSHLGAVLAALLALCSVLISLPGVPSTLLVVAVVLAAIWLRRICDVPTWAFALAVLLGAIAGFTQALQTATSSPADVLNAFARTYLMGAALVSVLARRRLHSMPHVAVILSVFLSLSFFIAVSTGFPSREYSASRLAGYLSDSGSIRPPGWAASPNEMAAIIGIGLVLLIVTWINWSEAKSYQFVIAGLMAAGAIILTSTRSVLIATLLASAVTVLVGRRWKMSLKRRVILFAFLGAAVVVAIVGSTSGRDLFGRDGDGSAVYRTAVISRVWVRLLTGEASVTGVGLVDGNQLPPNKLTAGIEVVDGSFFYVAAYLGIAGLVAMVVTILSVAIVCIRRRNLGLPILAFFVCMMFFENIVAWPSTLVLIVACGGILGGSNADYQQRAILWQGRVDKSSEIGSRGGTRRMVRHIP